MALKPSYRVATPDDHRIAVALLWELVDELGPLESSEQVKQAIVDDIARALDSETIRIFLAEHQGEVIGLSRADILTADPIFRLRPDHRCGYVDQMFVRPAYRGRRIGSELLRLCEEWFRQQEIAHCILHAAPRAVRFYARKGYQPNREMFKKL